MLSQKTMSFINALPLGEVPGEVERGPAEVLRGEQPTAAAAAPAAAEPPITTVDVTNLPSGLVTGGNLVQFSDTATPDLRASVALSLLAAQRVAATDPVIQTPDQWLQRHNTVLENLNWIGSGGGVVNSTFNSINVAVHQAIIPFLTAAFGPAVAAGSLIITALTQLGQIDSSSPWITLFDQQSRRFDITEYQFSTVEVTGSHVQLKIAAARFDASYGKTQVLFFSIKQEHASFQLATGSYSSQMDLQESMNGALKAKLAAYTNLYIQGLPDNLG